MNTVRFIARILYYISRAVAVVILATTIYAVIILILSGGGNREFLPIQVLDDGTFEIFFPFTRAPFLLGDYTMTFMVSYFLTLGFYGLFLWLLGGVFYTFKQSKLFTSKGVIQLSRFYILNLAVPFVFLLLFAAFGHEFFDVLRIMPLHLVIAVFAFFMTAIFKQGVLLQEEQDLTL